MARKYLFVEQGCISRWQYDPSIKETKDYGFYTDKFFNCIIIVLREKISQKLAMIHADSQIMLEDLKKEIDWVGQNCEKYIYYKEHPKAEETIDDLFSNDTLRSQFSFNMIRAKKKGGHIIPDLDLPPLPDGSRVPEFEATTIYADLANNNMSYFHLKGKEYIDDFTRIQHIYKVFQYKDWQTFANLKGSNHILFYEMMKNINLSGTEEASSAVINLKKQEKQENLLLKESVRTRQPYSNENRLFLPSFNSDTDAKENLREAIRKIVPNKDWKVPSVNRIWLQLSNEEEAQKIVSHFKQNGYQNIMLSHRKDSPGTPIIVLDNVNYSNLANIPSIQTTIQEEDTLKNIPKF